MRLQGPVESVIRPSTPKGEKPIAFVFSDCHNHIGRIGSRLWNEERVAAPAESFANLVKIRQVEIRRKDIDVPDLRPARCRVLEAWYLLMKLSYNQFETIIPKISYARKLKDCYEKNYLDHHASTIICINPTILLRK